jgi:serine/threonine-protein kinase
VLRGAHLEGADLSGAHLQGTALHGARMQDAKVTEDQLAVAHTDPRTVLPEAERAG